jgi:hypothetical protein
MKIFCCLDDWQERLHNYILRRQNEAFKWGAMDCCLFAADAVKEITGTDLGAEFRGSYDDLISAARVMRDFIRVEQGLEPVENEIDAHDLVERFAEKLAARFAIEEVPVLCAQRGDVVLLDSPMGKGLGVVGLHGTHVHATGPDGIVDIPLAECERAWRVPKGHPLACIVDQ